MRIYLAGPMSNVPYFNFPAFFAGADMLRKAGHTVFSPAENDIEVFGDFWRQCPNGSHDELSAKGENVPTYRECLRMDLNWILDHAEAIALLPGWERSKGVKAEKALADCLGLAVIEL